jgi:phospholipase C
VASTVSVSENAAAPSADLALTLTNTGYDFTVTVSTDSSWSRRYTGHLENSQVSITG